MFSHKRYPIIGLHSKNELAKRIAGKGLSRSQALELINDALQNFDRYWYDSDHSEPEKGKFVRSAVGNSLGKLLKLIDTKVLAPYDSMIPDFIFGGLSGKNHIQAAHHLLGEQRKRTLLKLDVKRFFEQIHEERVFYFFHKKCSCSVVASRLLAHICCVPSGPKGSGSTEKILARGFATSSRLALWCNLDLFVRLDWKIKRKLHGHDPRIAIFVDDIGITASKVEKDHMESFSKIMEDMLASFDPNQSLPINQKKKEIVSYKTGMDHLGLRLGRNKLTIGGKSRSKRDRVVEALKLPLLKEEKKILLQKRGAYYTYQKQIKNKGVSASD